MNWLVWCLLSSNFLIVLDYLKKRTNQYDVYLYFSYLFCLIFKFKGTFGMRQQFWSCLMLRHHKNAVAFCVIVPLRIVCGMTVYPREYEKSGLKCLILKYILIGLYWHLAATMLCEGLAPALLDYWKWPWIS